MSQDRKVVFRRVRGRIIPIRVQESAKNIAKGVGIAALGAGVALGASFASGKGLRAMVRLGEKVQKSTRTARVAFDVSHAGGALGGLGKRVSDIAIQRGGKNLKKMNRVSKLSKATLFGGRLVGATLVGVGAEKVAEELVPGKTDSLVGIAAGTAASTGSFMAFTAGYDKSLATELAKRLVKVK